MPLAIKNFYDFSLGGRGVGVGERYPSNQDLEFLNTKNSMRTP